MRGLTSTFCRASALLLALGLSAHAASDWQVVKVGPRDYLTLDNIAKFYGLPTGVQPGGPQGKTLNLDNGRIQLTVTLDSREAIINGVRNWLCFPIVAKDGHYLMSRIDLAKTVEPEMRPQMIPNLAKIDTVVLDPGHGGHDNGACSVVGCEKDFVLDIARQLKPLLEAKGLKVVMTRDSDVFIPLEERARIANRTPNCIFVSLHLNATDWNPAAAGFEIYSLTPRGAPSTADNALALRFFDMQAGSAFDAQSLALSMSIYHSVVGHLSEFDRGIKRARFAVLRQTRVPAVLVEGGFITERNEGKLIANSQWRARYAQSISIGIEGYKLLVEKRQRPWMVADYHRQLGNQLIARDATQPPPADNPALIPASNTQGRTAESPSVTQLTEPPHNVSPNENGTARAPSEQEQEEAEPNEPKNSNVTAESPAPAATVTAADVPPTPEEAMPDNSPPAKPEVAEEPPKPPAQSTPAATPARPLQEQSLGERILRWIPAMPRLLP